MSDKNAIAENLDWVRRNALNPFVNGLLLEPAQALRLIVNSAAHTCGANYVLPELELLETSKAQVGSAEFWVQNISSGLSFVIPYAGAGRLAGAGLRCTAMALKLESTAAKLSAGKEMMNTALKVEQLMVSKPAASILGGVAYDGLKDLHEGQSRAGNMGRSAAQFGCFESLNAASKLLPQSGPYSLLMKHLLVPAAIGATGATAGALTEAGIIGRNLDLNELANHAVAGGALNLVLPHAQETVMRHIRLPQVFQADTAVSATAYADRHNLHGKSSVLDLMLARNPLARVEEGEYTSAKHKTGKITLQSGATAAELAHELHHLQRVRREGGRAGSIDSRLHAEKLARQIENRAASQSGASDRHRDINIRKIANEKTPNGLTYTEHFRAELEGFSASPARAEVDFSGLIRTGKRTNREANENPSSRTSSLHSFESLSSIERIAVREALAASAAKRSELGWEQSLPFTWQRQSQLSSKEIDSALAAAPTHWKKDGFFADTFKTSDSQATKTLKIGKSLTIQTADSTYSICRNGIEQIVDRKNAQINYTESVNSKIESKRKDFEERQQDYNRLAKEQREEQRQLFEAKKEQGRKEAEEFQQMLRDPLFNAAYTWRETKFDGSVHPDMIQERFEKLHKAMLEAGLAKEALDLSETRTVEEWLWEIYLAPHSFNETVKHGMRENPDANELHHKHMMNYLKLPETKEQICSGKDIRAGAESLVFLLADGKDVFKIMRPKFKEQIHDIENYGKRPFDAELRSPIKWHKSTAEVILTYKQERLETLSQLEYLANPEKWNALLKQISDAGYICPDVEGKWWQAGKNSRGEWKLLDYGAAIKKR